MKIGVIGGTGMLGQPTVEKLIGEGFGVRVLSRDPERTISLFGADVEHGVADVGDLDSLRNSLRGCDAVHINLSTDRGADPEVVFARGLTNVGKAAKELDLKYVSLVAGDWVPDENHASPRRRNFSKGIHALEASGVPTVVWAATWFFESLEYFVLRDRALMVGMQPLEWHFIAADDYTDLVAKALRRGWTGNQRFTVHGLERFKMFDALNIYCATLHPGLPVEQLSIAGAKEFAATNETHGWLGGFADFMSLFETEGETGDSRATFETFGAPKWTLEAWAKVKSKTGK